MAFVPAVARVLVLTRIPDQPGVVHERESSRQNWQQLSAGLQALPAAGGVFALAYFSLGFILLKAHDVGFGVTEVVLLYALFNATCVIAAPLVGQLGDRIGRNRIVVLGYAVYAGINLWLVFASSRWEVIAVFAVYGFFYAIDESQSKAFIADLEPERRATAVRRLQLRRRRDVPACIPDRRGLVGPRTECGLCRVDGVVGRHDRSVC